ncbi:DUF3108 domain-containing protein [Thiohalobacter sp. IOR34]|uniref:DUF3108 domain-containing protein n=1 Tax=Thiohalobacter sp. IOR34 TaxID=3057176 RepID=UPI0025B20D66|nr:DUF3108 domain-containing protein [Thiohalobacter sp. IOR34]WJW76060.1 DUF3108 domain-containing protein [Thiohalobacter sp. IOR34]
MRDNRLPALFNLLAGVLLALLAPLQAVRAESELRPFEAVYRLKVNRLTIGEQRLQLERLGDGRYRLSSHTRPIGIGILFRSDRLSESSEFELLDGRLRPIEYRFDRSGGRKERHARLSFDWAQGQVTNDVAGHAWRMDIPPGTLDKLSVQLALMLDLQQERRELRYAIADGGRLKTFEFRIIGEESVRLPGGDYPAIKLQRLRKDQDRTTYLWCAPALGYLPVQLEQIEHEDGLVYLSQLTAFRFTDGE